MPDIHADISASRASRVIAFAVDDQNHFAVARRMHGCAGRHRKIDCVAMLVLGLGDSKYALPLGSFLALAAVVTTATGDRLIQWYGGFY